MNILYPLSEDDRWSTILNKSLIDFGTIPYVSVESPPSIVYVFPEPVWP